METKDKAPRHLFQPTSFLNPGYGVLFEHIGQLHQSVYKHYLIVALKIPTLHHMPHDPEQWHRGCKAAVEGLITPHDRELLQDVFNEDYCSTDRFKQLYTDIAKTLHSDIPALLPNQEVPYADWQFFNTTPVPLSKNIYHPEHPDKVNNRPTRDVSDSAPLPDPLPLLEVQRALDYVSKYGEPIPLEADTIYAEQHNNVTLKRHKRFLGGLIRGITSIFKGGNIFGKIVSGIKKVGGFIFKGIKGLLHRRKNTALLNAAKSIAARSRRFLVSKLYKFKHFKGLHIGRSSLSTTLKSTFKRLWHRSRLWFPTHFIKKMYSKMNSYRDLMMIDKDSLKAMMNYTNGLISFVNYRRESLMYLEKTDTELHRLVYGLEKLTNGQLSTSILPARLLHKFLHKILREVRIQHTQFVPLYTELHHYYESGMNSYSNDREHIFIQIPIFFVAANQRSMELFRIHTVPVPLDIDTYQGKESKYTTLDLQYKYLATNGQEYMDITDSALESCSTYHMDHLCENLHVTTDVKELNCAIAIYMDSVETSSHSAKHILNII